MIHPNRMMETAMPMKPAVILRRSEGKEKSKKKDMKMAVPRENSQGRVQTNVDLLVLKFILQPWTSPPIASLR